MTNTDVKLAGILHAKALGYLATPYSRYADGMEAAFEHAAALVGRLLSERSWPVYSPIAHTHPVAKFGKLDPLDHGIWLPFDELMMWRCDYCLVAEMAGWEKSYGIGHEIEWFAVRGKPVIYLDPITLRVRATPLASVLPAEERPFA